MQARFKDPDLSYQRIILLLGLVRTGMQKLIDWLSTDALKFELVFLGEEGKLALTHEYQLLELMFREQIQNGTIDLLTLPHSERVVDFCQTCGSPEPVPLSDDFHQRSAIGR